MFGGVDSDFLVLGPTPWKISAMIWEDGVMCVIIHWSVSFSVLHAGLLWVWSYPNAWP